MLAFALAGAGGAAGAEESARASLAAELATSDPVTGRTIRVEAGQPFRLSAMLTDVTTGRAPRGVALAGSIRAVVAGNSDCRDAARAFRVTAEAPFGATDLNGILLVSVNEDASVGVIDPKLNLKSSNMIAAARLDAPPVAMAVDPESFRAFFVLPDAQGIVVISILDGAQEVLLSDMALSDVVARGGRVWLGREDGAILATDAPEAAQVIGLGGVRFRASSEPDSPLVAAFGAGGGLSVFDAATGRTVFERARYEALADLALLADGTVLSLPKDGDVMRIVYGDAPDHAVDVPLGLRAGRITASPDGRHAIAYAPAGAGAVVIDVVRGEVVQPLAFTQGGISDVAFTDEAAYLLSLDGGFAGLIDLDSVAPGRAAQIRKIDLARKAADPVAGEGLLVPLWPSPQVIAVSPETQTGWILHDNQAVGEMPPMDSVGLRGGVPARLAVLDRSLREVAPGHFQTVAVLPAGEHELVLTTGIGGMTACLPLSVRGGSDAQAIEPVTLALAEPNGPLMAGQDINIALTFRDRKGAVVPVERAEFLVPSLASSWIGRMSLSRSEDGTLRGQMRFPHPGPFVLQPLGLPRDLYLTSALLLEVSS